MVMADQITYNDGGRHFDGVPLRLQFTCFIQVLFSEFPILSVCAMTKPVTGVKRIYMRCIVYIVSYFQRVSAMHKLRMRAAREQLSNEH